MKLTVLGCYGPYPKARGACSGYLLEDDNFKVLIDCGNGVVSRMFSHFNDLNKLDAIFVSHLHPDHISDLMVLRYAVHLEQKSGRLNRPIELYLPASPKEDFDRIQYQQAYSRIVIHESLQVEIKGVSISFFKTDHPVECYGMTFKKGNKKLVYSADTKYFPRLVDIVKDSDLFLCEGGILELDRDDNVPHLSARQVAEIATKANLKRIIITHLYPKVKVVSLYDEARDIFPHIIEIAEEGRTYYI